MNTVFLLLGGNLGDVQSSFEIACQFLQKQVGIIEKKSELYSSPAWGFESKNNFLNQVLKLHTDQLPLEVLFETQKIENEMGRKRNAHSKTFESRLIDIDILYYNEEIIKEENLIIPHYAMHHRNFTMKPITEIAANFIHPVLNKTNEQLLNECTDKSIVTKL